MNNDQEDLELLSVANKPHHSNSSNLPREILKGLLGNWSAILLFLILMGVSGGLLYGVIQTRNDMTNELTSLSNQFFQNMTKTQQELKKAIQDINATLVNAFQQIDIIEKNISQLTAKQLLEEIRNTEKRINASATDIKQLILDTTEKLNGLQHQSEADLIQLKNLSTQVNQTIQSFYQQVNPITNDLDNLKENMTEVHQDIASIHKNLSSLFQESSQINSTITLLNRTSLEYTNALVQASYKQLHQEIDHVNTSITLLNAKSVKQSVLMTIKGEETGKTITPKAGTSLPFSSIYFNETKAPIITILWIENSQSILLKGGHQYLLEAAPFFNFECPGACLVAFGFTRVDNNQTTIIGTRGDIFPNGRLLDASPQHTARAFVQEQEDVTVQLRIVIAEQVASLKVFPVYSYLSIITLS